MVRAKSRSAWHEAVTRLAAFLIAIMSWATKICGTLLVVLGTGWAQPAAIKCKIPRKSSCGEVAERLKAAVC
jgi:hypothetical protein